jgi:hypothetical protein
MMRRVVLVASSLVLASSCAPKLDTTREPADTGSFGTTVFTLACQRVAYQRDLVDGDSRVDVSGSTYRDACRHGGPLPANPYPAIAALVDARDPIIAAVDVVFPADFLADLQAYLTGNAFLGLYDDGTMEAALTKVVDLLGLMADDPDFAPSLARLSGRIGYRPRAAALGAVRAAVQYPKLGGLVQELTTAIAEGGPAHTEFVAFQKALAMELADTAPLAPAAAGAPDRTLRLAANLLLTESPLLGNGVVRPAAVRDVRGLAVVEKDPMTNKLAAPFVDVDGDGLADIDVEGRYVDAAGLPITNVPTPFASPLVAEAAPARDAEGRALIAEGGPRLYRYLDLDKTPLAALVRDVPQLFDPQKGTALDFLRGASALLGPRKLGTTKTFQNGTTIDYRGYDTSQAPLLDMVYGFLVLVDDPNLPTTLAFARSLIVDHEAEAARLLEAFFAVADLADLYPEAQLAPGSALFDDLMPVMKQVLAEPKLVEDLLKALEDPATKQVRNRFADYMEYADRFDLDASAAPYPVTGSFKTKVNRAAVDSNFNRSLMQRLLHLIHDSYGVSLCNKQDAEVLGILTFDECEMFKIDDLAIFYVQSIACQKNAQGQCRTDDGHYMPKAFLELHLKGLEGLVSDDMVESLTTIEGFRRHPTPQALNRALLLDPAPQFIQDTLNPARDIDGDRYIDQHAGSLPVWEVNGFYDQIRPVIQAFADHGKEELFVKILVALHEHWPSKDSVNTQSMNPQGPGYAKASGVKNFEPLMVDVLRNSDLLPALTESAPTLAAISVGGKNGRTILENASRYLVNDQAGLVNRLGQATTTTVDGRPVPVLSPWYVLADAYRQKAKMVGSSASEGEAWERSTGQMVDVFLRGEKVGDAWRFKNPRVRGVSAALIDFLQARIAAHKTAGDLKVWARTDLPARLESVVTGPVFAGAADFVLSLAAAPAARAALEDLHVYLMNEVGAMGSSDTFVAALGAVADLVQLFLDDPDMVPVARLFGKALHPDFGLVDAQVRFLRGARAADTTDALQRLLHNAFAEAGPGKVAIGQVIDALCDVHRVDPIGEHGAPLDAEDFRATFRAVADFIFDERRGFLKFVQIVKARHVDD